MNTLGTCSADSEFLVGTGAGEFAWESGATVRTSLGLGAVALLSSVGLADIAAAAKGYDMALYAGFDITFVKEDIAVQIYAKFTAARDFTYTSEVADIETAPTGQALTVDVLINGTSVYSTVPEFAATATTLTAGVVKSDGTEDVSAGDVITFKVLQVGSSEPGEGMTFSILGVLA